MDERRQRPATPPEELERRQGQRRQGKRIDVEFWVEASEEDSRYHLAANVSIGGLFLESPLPLPPGTRTQLALHIPGDPQPLKCGGEVLKAEEGGGMNVRFYSVADEDKPRLETLVEAMQLPDPENLG